MKFSKSWLQDYSKEPLPETGKLQEIVTLNAFEIEEVFTYGNDDILDIKVLPNRAHDALCHRGMAQDICALVGTAFTDPNEYYEGDFDASVATPSVSIEDMQACTRFMSVRIEGVKVTDSPEWLKEKLLSIGQKSINSIVDITNYVQFCINKPMHAYDADLISGNELSARFARPGENLVTLDDKGLALDEATLVIADAEKPLGLAGIKGGKHSGVHTETKSIIVESANFNPTLIRKTSQKYGVRTDASKRFENEISDELVEEGIRMTISLVQKLNPNARISIIADVGNRKSWDYTVSVSVREVNGLLGTSFTEGDIAKIFSDLGFVSRIATTRQILEEKLKEAENATYKNPSSMREDAPHAFSCSSLMSFLFSGIWQPSISIDKYVYADHIAEKEVKWGDLVFSNTGEGRVRTESVQFLPGTRVESGIDHVGLCMGNGMVAHISKRTNALITESIAGSPSFKSGVVYARLVDIDEPRFFVKVPHVRLDIRLKEDLIEEVARMRGLSSIPSVLPTLARKGVPHKRLFYENKIKKILEEKGFSEIMTYSFGDAGDVEIMKGSALDKEKLRNALVPGLEKAFQLNVLNAPLLNLGTIRMYEFGNVFTPHDERRHFALVLDDGKKKSSFAEEVDTVMLEIENTLGVSELKYKTVTQKPICIELDFDAVIEHLPEPEEYHPLIKNSPPGTYQPISPYPFIVRDIAVWVPEQVTWEDIKGLVSQVHSPLIVRIDCFDTFSKEIDSVRKTSFAFRCVLQAKDRTLTDSEANEVAEKMYTLLKGQGYEIR